MPSILLDVFLLPLTFYSGIFPFSLHFVFLFFYRFFYNITFSFSFIHFSNFFSPPFYIYHLRFYLDIAFLLFFLTFPISSVFLFIFLSICLPTFHFFFPYFIFSLISMLPSSYNFHLSCRLISHHFLAIYPFPWIHHFSLAYSFSPLCVLFLLPLILFTRPFFPVFFPFPQC